MPNVNGIIEIGRNRIRYYDEDLKISNISRTWIFRFQNRERIAHEKAKKDYERAKDQYEMAEERKKREKTRNYVIATIILLVISMFFVINKSPIGLITLIAAGICGYFTYKTKNETIAYDVDPPQERFIPDRYGLGIEMNSGYSVVFTAIGNDGKRALRILQNDINDAGNQKDITIFNMNDNRITVENNDGIINTGDNAENKIEEKEPLGV